MDTPNARTVTRRTAIRGSAWSIPVIALASAAPAVAASDPITAGIVVMGIHPIKVGALRTDEISVVLPRLQSVPVTMTLPAGVATWTDNGGTTISGVTGWANMFGAEMQISPRRALCAWLGQRRAVLRHRHLRLRGLSHAGVNRRVRHLARPSGRLNR